MTANGSKSYLPYLNKLVDQSNNTCHSIIKKPINADYSPLTEKIETNHKTPKFKVNDRVRITKYKNIFSKVTLKISQEKYLLSIMFWKLILGHINQRFKQRKSFYKKELFRVYCFEFIIKMIYYPEPGKHIRDKVNLVLDLSTYATKKELDHAKALIDLVSPLKKILLLWKLKLTK